MKLRLSALALGVTMLVGCASSGEQTGRSDPLEGFNRSMYSFNYNVLDPYLVRPVAVAWRDYVPQPARNGLSNFTSNPKSQRLWSTISSGATRIRGWCISPASS